MKTTLESMLTYLYFTKSFHKPVRLAKQIIWNRSELIGEAFQDIKDSLDLSLDPIHRQLFDLDKEEERKEEETRKEGRMEEKGKNVHTLRHLPSPRANLLLFMRFTQETLVKEEQEQETFKHGYQSCPTCYINAKDELHLTL